MDLIGAEPEGGHGGDIGPHAAAPEPVDLESCLCESRDHPDVRVAASTAAGEHETERAPGDTPRDPRHADVVGGLVDEVVGRGRDGVEPLRCCAPRQRSQQDEVAVPAVRPDRRVAVGEEQHPVGLATCEGVPAAGLGADACNEEHEVRRRLGTGEGCPPVVGLAVAAEHGGRSMAPQLPLEGSRKTCRIDPGRERRDREHARPRRRSLEPTRCLQLAREQDGHGPREPAVRVEKRCHPRMRRDRLLHASHRARCRCGSDRRIRRPGVSATDGLGVRGPTASVARHDYRDGTPRLNERVRVVSARMRQSSGMSHEGCSSTTRCHCERSLHE